jgi:GntR family galactonate operon transcriptional repressor
VTRYVGRGVHGQTVELLAGRIISGGIGEGETIDIQALGSELDVSLTALREALKVLAAKGLVDARQKRGTFVRPRSDWNLLDGDIIRWQFSGLADPRFRGDLAELRAIVEPAVARLAAERHTASDIDALESALGRMIEADGDPEAAVRADLEFHRGLLASSHNELLQRMEVVLQTGLAERDKVVHGASPADDPVPSHRAVLDAICAGDPTAAEGAMRDLLEKASRDLDRALRDRRD